MELSPPCAVVGKEEQELLERTFFSWAEFSRFFDKWCQQRLVVFSVKRSTHVARSPWASTPPLYRLIHVLKYSFVLLVCKDVRGPNQPSEWPAQPRCPAFITLKLSPLRDRLVVSQCQLTHSHPACPRKFAYHFRPGYLLANACLPLRLTNQISKQFVAPEDVRRLLSHCKGPDHGVQDALQVLEGLFRTDPEAKVKLVFVEDQAEVETVFFLTSRTRALLRRFPRILLVDRLPGLRGALDLMTVLCVDGAGRARQAACCVARPGTPSLLRFLLVSLLQSAPDIKGRVRCLTAGPEVAAQARAVRQLLPCARVQICRVQGLETLFSRAQELGGAGREDPGLWPLLCRLASAPCYAVYAEALAELRAQGPAAFVSYFDHNWAPCHDMWVRFRAYEAAHDLDACALVRGHRRRLLRCLGPSHSVAQCLSDLVAMQWADAVGEEASRAGGGDGAWLEAELGTKAPVGREDAGVLELSDRGARPDSEKRGELPATGGPGGRKRRGLEAIVCRELRAEPDCLGGPEVRAREDAQLGDGALRVPGRKGAPCVSERAGGSHGSSWRRAQARDGEASGRKPGDQKGPGLGAEKGRGRDIRRWWEIPSEGPVDLGPDRDDPREPRWGLEGQRELAIAEDRGGEPEVKRRRGLEEIVVVQLEDRVAGVANGDDGAARAVGAQSRTRQAVQSGNMGGRRPGLGNGVHRASPVETAVEGSPGWAVTRRRALAVREALQEGDRGDSPRVPQRPCGPPGEEEVGLEPLARFREVCGPELADLVAEELTFARQHGIQGFHWTGAGFALKDGTSDFFLNTALTYCSCSIHAAHHLPCRHLFAARLFTGAALFHMDLLRDCWARAQEP
ncbi:uncharacterized protein ZSWIM9 [Ctenodactylus gundi]